MREPYQPKALDKVLSIFKIFLIFQPYTDGMRNNEENRLGAPIPNNEPANPEDWNSDNETVILEPGWEKQNAPDPRQSGAVPPQRQNAAVEWNEYKQDEEKQEKEPDELPFRSEFQPF